MQIENAITDGLRHLTGQFSVSKAEWNQQRRGGDDLLQGLLSHGYVITDGERYAVSEAGRRRLQAAEPSIGEAE